MVPTPGLSAVSQDVNLLTQLAPSALSGNTNAQGNAQGSPTLHLKPLLGSTDMPTLGSRNHGLGSCTPCAFFRKGRCENGLDCGFCHLCEPGQNSKKRANKGKEKVTILKA